MKFLIFAIFSVMIVGFTLNAYSESIDEMHDSAYEFMKMGKFVEAIEMYTKILEIEEYDETALLNRAVAFANSGDEELGLACPTSYANCISCGANSTDL